MHASTGGTIHQDRTGTAIAGTAAVFGPGEPQLIPQHFDEELIRFNGKLVGLAIDD